MALQYHFTVWAQVDDAGNITEWGIDEQQAGDNAVWDTVTEEWRKLHAEDYDADNRAGLQLEAMISEANAKAGVR